MLTGLVPLAASISPSRRMSHVPHARSPTVERRAYGRPARGLSSWCCVAGHSDATCAGL